MSNDPTIPPKRKRGRPRKSDSPPAPPPDTSALLPDDKEALRVECRFEEIRTSSGADTEKRLRELYAIWRNPLGSKSLKASEEKELIRAGIVKSELSLTGLIANGDACAEFIRKTFQFPCTRKDVSDWMRGRRLPVGASPFPLKTTDGHFKAIEVESWGKAYLPKVGSSNGNAGKDPRQIKEANEARISQLEADELERSLSNKWIQFAIVKNYVFGMAGRVCLFYDKMIEDSDGLRKIVRNTLEGFVTPEQILVIDERLAIAFISANDDLKAEFKRAQLDAQKHFDDARKEQSKTIL